MKKINLLSPSFIKAVIFAVIVFVNVITAFAQSITGKVVNSSNQPVSNALILRTDNLSVFTKTASDGSFTISGNAGSKLWIAALHYQTIKSYTVASMSNVQITLQKDLLLNSDVYHISFDHLRPGDFYSRDELKKDFPVPSGAGFYESNNDSTNRAFVDHFTSVDKDGQSLRVRFPKGVLKTANSGVDARIPLAKTYTNNDFKSDELYLSYWVKFSDNFQFDKCGGKLPSLGGSDHALRTNLWKGRIMWRNKGSIQFYMELPHGEDNVRHDSIRFWGDKIYHGGDICTNEFTSYLREPGWHNIELHYKLDNGTPTGLFEGWVDGDKGHKIINSREIGFYRPQGAGLDNLTINAILLSAFLGGSDSDYEPTEDVFAWFDEFRVSNTRINEYKKYAGDVVSSNKKEIKRAEHSVYPNPSQSGIFTIKENISWSVLNSMGIVIYSGSGNSIDLSREPAGIYFLKTDKGLQSIIRN